MVSSTALDIDSCYMLLFLYVTLALVCNFLACLFLLVVFAVKNLNGITPTNENYRAIFIDIILP